jgi:hypothetical protein
MKRSLLVVATLILGTALSVQAQSQKGSLKEQTALILNLNGLLCAEVVDIRPLKVSKDVYEVECIEYRGGKARKTYIMDAAKGTAWKP